MINTVTLTGMVLTAMPIGDFDKRLVILTRERGKITAFAKGARRQNSALLACSQPFSFGEFTLIEGRSSYNLKSVEITNYFVEMRENFEAVYYGMYFCEFADYLSRENVEGTATLKLLYQTLRALIRNSIPYELICYIFELKILSINGEAPQVFECVKCRSEGQMHVFSSSSGGLLCGNCVNKASDRILLNDSTIYAMQFIISSAIEKLYTFTVSDDVRKELSKCLRQYKSVYVDKDFKTYKMLEEIRG